MNQSRRGFLAASASALAGSGPAAQSPNDTIGVGLIGCGARGRSVIIPNFGKVPGVRFTAVCDVNSKYLAMARESAGGQNVATYKDYRKLLEDKNVDVVVIATNAQWHALPAIAACQAGKDIYLEKPLGQSIGEGPFVIEAAKRYGRIVQVGTQQRSQEHYRRAVELIQAGKLGDISEIKVWDYENNAPGSGFPGDTDPPQELDWNFYVGPSPWRAYNPNMYYNYGYDWFKVAGAGHQVAWGVHHFDIVLWAMGVTAPKKIYAAGGNFAFRDNRDYPNTFSATLEFGPGPVAKDGFLLQYTMRVGNKRETRAHGKCFYGTQASMVLDRTGFSIVPEVRRGEKPAPHNGLLNPEQFTPAEPDHLRHIPLFLQDVRSRKQPSTNAATLHLATTVAHLMNISWECGRAITWDSKSESVVGDPEANRLVMRPYRAPWKLSV